MLNVAISPNAMQPNAALIGFAPPRNAFERSNSPSFSQTLSATEDARLRPMVKPGPAPRSHAGDFKAQAESGKALHSAADPAPQTPVTASPAATPAANPQASTAPAANAQTSDTNDASDTGTSRDGEPVVGAQNATESGAGSALPANAAAAGQQAANASSTESDAGSATGSSTERTIEEFEKEVGCRIFDANNQANVPVQDQSDVDTTSGCNAESPKGANTPTAPMSATSHAQANATTAPTAIAQGNGAAQDAQRNATPTAAAPQAGNAQISLPNAARLISAAAAGDETAPAKASLQNRQSIAQRIQPASPNLDAALANGAQPVPPPFAANDNGSAGGNNPGGSSAQSGGHSTDQAQHDSKSSDASDSSHGSTQPLNAPTPGLQNSPNANATPAAGTAVGIQSAHIAAHAAAQANASGDSGAAPKSPADATPTANQPSLPASAATTLPRSLSDVNQAAQLYQQVGRAEMHISMDTDTLGSIDLRAVVHQGSLSATIGVQHADVQTLLVNELPALQHSLAEKNFQVNNISVLAGSIGSGANPDGQPRDQQDHQRTAPAFTPLFCDAPPPMLSRGHSNEVAASMGNLARLSVIA